MGAMKDRAIDARNVRPGQAYLDLQTEEPGFPIDWDDEHGLADETRQLALLHWAKTPLTNR